MFFKSIWKKYEWIQIREFSDVEKLDTNTQYVIKPDMLFWKRGKRGLLWLNLSKSECKDWLKKYFMKSENIDGVDGVLEVFLAEPFVKPETEFYISFAQSRDGDILTFSDEGWVDIEENWEKTQQLIIPVTQELTPSNLDKILKTPQSWDSELWELILKLWKYYRSYWYISLEFNPIALDNNWELKILDAVAKIDDQESYLQKTHWSELEIPNNYGFQENAWERYIRELDAQTGASLKLKILNPEARIWTLLAGGGGSLVITDTLWALGCGKEIGNYGECSWNPSREFTREYTKTILKEMLANKIHWKYLIIAGAIANFTHIDSTFSGVIDAFELFAPEIREQQIQILVRRGGINEKKWLTILEDACKRLQIPALVTGSDTYMTDILREIKL